MIIGIENLKEKQKEKEESEWYDYVEHIIH